MDPAGRDLGLRRLSRLTRWSVGGAVALTGVFSVLVAHARPGHAKSGATTSPAPSATTVPAASDSLAPPVQPPAAGAGGAVATSGAS